jgi:putative membrane protein
MSEQKPADANALALERTELARNRTIAAEERTLMAWIRTSISMIGFGFTIYNFFKLLIDAASKAGVKGVLRVAAPRNFGLFLVGFGTLMLIFAAIRHRIYLNRIGVEESKHLWSLEFITALIVSLVGIVAFISILIQGGPL